MNSRRGTSNKEAGQALVFVTLVLALAMLVLPSLLNFMGGAGRAAQIREDRMLKVYAADAGIEEAYHRVLYGIPGDFTIEDVNGYTVHVEITEESGGMWRAVATSTGYEGANASIEAYFGEAGYIDFLDNVISSNGQITIKPGAVVVGNISSNVEPKIQGTHVGNITIGDVPAWPEAGALGVFYSDLVEDQAGGACPSEGTVFVDGNVTLVYGPCETSGDLKFQRGVGVGGNVSLNGVLYVSGDFTMGKNLNLYLNGNTIYAEGFIKFEAVPGHPGDAVNIYGPGCIIAEGDVDFNPKPGTDESFIFVMSVGGEINAKPMGDFYGAFAGNTEVDLLPNVSLTWIPYRTDESGDPFLDFPGGGIASARVVSYVIRR